MANDLVGYSRAGDVFHYRWAARRCLGLVLPNSALKKVIIEGSADLDKAGEYVIDVAEYSDNIVGNEKINYYQLKHSTVQKEKPFKLSDFKKTLEGFALRYTQHSRKKENFDFQFTIITNRKIDDSLKDGIVAVAENRSVNKAFLNTLIRYTKLSGPQLQKFCCKFVFQDGEGDYNVQKDELKVEINQLITGATDNSHLASLTSLIQEKVLPDSNGTVLKEDILRCFGITSEKKLYPAETVWEEIDKTIIREQHNDLKNKILASVNPVIIHAAGGVGKSVFTRQLVKSLSGGSLAIAYDCFGAGSYRNRSTTRHLHRTALVQIANELATKGLCDPLLVMDTTLNNDIMRDFLQRIGSAANSLRQSENSANLVIIIDAADNAEMAAREFSDICFAHELIREKLSPGCKIVFLCRTERIDLLEPLSTNDKFELEPFSKDETEENLKNHYPDATEQDAMEFHRLTNGNPRVQANALDAKFISESALLTSLGPSGSTVESQIELQLERAVSKTKDILPTQFHSHIDSICLGLASLTPHIPIEILAKASNVDIDSVKSFVADIGRPLWISDDSVQFRDEPTETWFRKKFCPRTADFKKYITALEPLAENSAYAALMLPQLYLQAEQYSKLIDIALSDKYLPNENPIDSRNVRVYRLQFAFKASLKLKQYNDAVKLAMRAGEEVAGDERQLKLLQENIDLLVLLQSEEKVKEIAFKRLLKGKWNGSENIFSASLLSSIEDYRGESRGFLRAADNWLDIYFTEAKKIKKDYNNENKLEDGDILELAYAHLNVNSVDGCLKFLSRLKPPLAVFRIMANLTSRLIDTSRYELIDEMLSKCTKNIYFFVAITSELAKIGKFPVNDILEKALEMLSNQRTRIKLPKQIFEDNITPSILSFLEACIYRTLPNEKILKALQFYVAEEASQMVYSSHSTNERDTFLRALALRSFISKSTELTIENILPSKLKSKDKNYENAENIKEFEQIIMGLEPWYTLRINVISGTCHNLLESAKIAHEKSNEGLKSRYKSYDSLPEEIASCCLSILVLSSSSNESHVKQFFDTFLKNNKRLKTSRFISATRSAHRSTHLETLRNELEIFTYELIKSKTDDAPDEIANRFIMLSRAILVSSIEDASVYFEEAVEAVSKFGDEIIQRWDAVASLAEQAAMSDKACEELAYRFIRVAELVGVNVREKYWDRSKAINICIRMSAPTGIATLSRWRERGVGRFGWLHSGMIVELISSNKISVTNGISLSRFLDQSQTISLLGNCLKMPISNADKTLIFDELLPRFEVEGLNLDRWKQIFNYAKDHHIANEKLSIIMKSLGGTKIFNPEKPTKFKSTRDLVKFNWQNIFLDFDVKTSYGLSQSIKLFHEKISDRKFWVPLSVFWSKVVSQVEGENISGFVDLLLSSSFLSQDDIEEIFRLLPDDWRNKVSTKKKYPLIIKQFGKMFAHELTTSYHYNSFKTAMGLDAVLEYHLKDGIFEGLSSGNEFANADMFFGFVATAANRINVEEIGNLLDYSLSRFEMHLPEDFGDGPWSESLSPIASIDQSIANYIWSSLGSPQASIRWGAAHYILNLAKFNCTEILDELVICYGHDNAGAYGAEKYPFYDLHAKLYFLIALSRISMDDTKLLEKYADLFSALALEGKHILIQKFAKDIATNICKNSIATYDNEAIHALQNIGRTKYPLRNVKYNYTTDSYLHSKGKVKKDIDFHFGWDFDHYWFKPLGEVFGVHEQQVMELAAMIIDKRWGNVAWGYNNDPRVELWNNSYGENNTHHDHGSYPKIDRYDFYLSYHSMLMVASDLLDNMPVLFKRDYCEDEWLEWVSRHLLTRSDGKWLSDARSPVPLKRPSWITIDYSLLATVPLEINEDEFLECLKSKQDDNLWLKVSGDWQEKNHYLQETYHISSALVSSEGSPSLLNVSTTIKNSYDMILPSYKDNDSEIISPPFILSGWIKSPETSKELDQFDPLAGEIAYPPNSIGKNIAEKLKVIDSAVEQQWLSPVSSQPSIINKIWKSYQESNREEADQSGNVLECSLAFLKYLCATLQCELIIKVQIGRNHVQTRHGSSKEDKYREPAYKIFILSSNGKIRSTEKSTQLR
ncbi:P-loop NTPase family protein [Flavobacterium macacae]|uniref:ATP-binding protein n=1 Tax=Flavobacterium macacae TaxID=2488993 RepID=A0A3P3WDV7_9FLAO|nr:ATP-binding protein [Flavobacterium macacae]RRJ90743.1 ATP-binding protein [Flavobacterium macacae]